jgi:hypothetical protein
MTKYIWSDVILQNESKVKDRAEDQSFLITDNAIMDALEIMPFVYIRQIAKMTLISPTTLFHRLTIIASLSPEVIAFGSLQTLRL